MTTGERIKYYRERAGFTMEQLAKLIGVQNSAINKYEKGIVTNIPIERIKLIAAALDVSPEQLVEWNDEVVLYDYNHKLIKKRQNLRQVIDEESEDTLDFIHSMLSIPAEKRQELVKLTGLKEEDKHP